MTRTLGARLAKLETRARMWRPCRECKPYRVVYDSYDGVPMTPLQGLPCPRCGQTSAVIRVSYVDGDAWRR